MNKMVILEAKLHKNRISVHKIHLFVVKMCNNSLCVLEAKFSCGGHQTFSGGMHINLCYQKLPYNQYGKTQKVPGIILNIIWLSG